MDVIFERLEGNNLPIPTYQTPGSACIDLMACLTRPMFLCSPSGHKQLFTFDFKADMFRCIDSSIVSNEESARVFINAGETVLIPTGFKISFPSNMVMKIFIRSSQGLKGLMLANSVGIIDSDYRGEIMIALHNYSGGFTKNIFHGERIAQASFELIERPSIVEGIVDMTERGAGGFGSTGV